MERDKVEYEWVTSESRMLWRSWRDNTLGQSSHPDVNTLCMDTHFLTACRNQGEGNRDSYLSDVVTLPTVMHTLTKHARTYACLCTHTHTRTRTHTHTHTRNIQDCPACCKACISQWLFICLLFSALFSLVWDCGTGSGGVDGPSCLLPECNCVKQLLTSVCLEITLCVPFIKAWNHYIGVGSGRNF